MSIIPSDRKSPDVSELSIDSLDIKVRIDNGHATVRLQEIFHNKTASVLEGTYVLALPGGAAVSDFAVWDEVTRIPGVILERKRASELYEQIRNQAIDPGLLESGEVTESEAPGQARHSSEFTVKIVPIPAQGYKRIEAEYRQTIPVTQLTAAFQLPLKPATYEPQTARKVSVSLELRGAHAISAFQSLSRTFPLKVSAQDDRSISASFEGTDVLVNDDLAISYKVADDRVPHVQAYRTGESEDPGYFEAAAVLGSNQEAQCYFRTVLVLFDTSLSMQWEKLERSFQALESTLRALRPADFFNVITFNSETQAATPQPVPATTEALPKPWILCAQRACAAVPIYKRD